MEKTPFDTEHWIIVARDALAKACDAAGADVATVDALCEIIDALDKLERASK